uniref:coiled-coil domain-containing protein 178 n=1 Tax=Jaculus jaculus TaxID=51337 RepID=UPI001E1B0043|nr:coiled-coil domain-containing protein 178 [Jaculus jaculus]
MYSDGNRFVMDRIRYAGVAVMTLEETLWAEALPQGTLAQKANLIALKKALILGKGKTVKIYTKQNPAHLSSDKGTALHKDGKTCLEIKALRLKAREKAAADNAMLQSMALFSAPKEPAEIYHESKMTNTEEVNKGIYFSYPCRRHSCAQVNIPAPCVNKLISHIEDIDFKIQEHLKQFETSFEEWSRISFTKESVGIDAAGKEAQSGEIQDEKCLELKQEMETLLSEVSHLIKSLETDRADAEQALKQQKSRKQRISMKIDSWSIWKLQELPTAVQKEHEAHLRDIIELRWHLEDRTNQLEHLNKEKAKIEEANAKIQVDIDFMHQHAPLLDSKRKQELDSLRERYHKKFEVMEIFRSVHEELEEFVEECENAKSKLKQMKEDIETDMYKDEVSLETYKRELDKLSTLQAHYSTSIVNVNIDIEEDEGTMTEVLRETETSSNEVSFLITKLDELKKLYDQLSWKQRNYEQQYREAYNHFHATRKTWDVEISNITKDFTDILGIYTTLVEENKTLANDIESVTAQVSESVRKKMQYESEIQSLVKVKMKNNDYLKQLYKTAYQIGAVYHVTKHKTEELEEKISEVRRKFKGREDFLKKLTRGEISTGMIIQKRLYSIQESQFLERQDLVRMKALYALVLSEIELPLQKLEEDAMRLRATHQEHTETLNDILRRKERVRKKVATTRKKLRKKSKKTRHMLTKTEGKRSIINQELEKAKTKTIILNEQTKELNKAVNALQDEKMNYDQKLENLKEMFFTLRYKREHAQAVFDHLMKEKRDCEDRIYEEEQRFRRLLTMRQNTLVKIQVIQNDSLEENLHLAQEYQRMQTIFLREKEAYFNVFDRLLSINASVSDKKKLCELQRRLRKQWQNYFRLLVLFNKRRLAKFQADSQENIQKILAVQTRKRLASFSCTFNDFWQ